MATNNGDSALAPETPVCKFLKKLRNDRAVKKVERDAAEIKIESYEIERGYAICTLAKSEETFEYYRNLNNFELLDMQHSAEIIKGNIDTDVKKDGEKNGGLGELIKEASKSLNGLASKLHDANNAACAMRNCLQSHMGFADDAVPEELTCVTELAKTLSDNGKKVAEAMATVAGIHTFSNLETLQPFGASLTGKLSELLKCTDGLIKAAKEAEDNAQADLTDILKKLNGAEFGYYRTTGVVHAYGLTDDFICKNQCEPIECVEEICERLGKPETDESSGSSFAQDDYD